MGLLSAGASLERRSLLKLWLACFCGTAAAVMIISGIKNTQNIAITSFTSSSLAVAIHVLINR